LIITFLNAPRYAAAQLLGERELFEHSGIQMHL